MVAEAIGIGVRHAVPIARSTWIVEPILYLTHAENNGGWQGIEGPIGRAAAAVFALGLMATAVLLCFHASGQPRTFKIGLGLFAGGGLTNAYELLVVGSVTDYLGIRGFGVVNLADILGDMGLLLAVLTWRPQEIRWPSWIRHRRVVLSLATAGAVVVVGFMAYDLYHGRTVRLKDTILLIVVIVVVVLIQALPTRRR